MGTASASGENAAVMAAQKAISCPMLDAGGVRGARGVLINIMGSSRLGLHEVNEACNLIREAAQNDDVQLNFGVVFNEAMNDEVKITVIATGFERETLPAIQRKNERGETIAPPPPVNPPSKTSVPVQAAPPPPAPAPVPAPVMQAAAAPQMKLPEEKAAAAPVPEEPAAEQLSMAASAGHTNGAPEPLLDDLDVPAILRRRMVQ
jgi:cell division protein FtsZ